MIGVDTKALLDVFQSLAVHNCPCLFWVLDQNCLLDSLIDNQLPPDKVIANLQFIDYHQTMIVALA